MQTDTYDFIVIGAGVIGTSVAFHLAELGAKKVLVVDRRQVATGTGAQSSGILRTHYSIAENVQLAHQSWAAFSDFAQYVDDPNASSGLVKCGYMIAAHGDEQVDALRSSLAQQKRMGITVETFDAKQARDCLPIARFHDQELIGYEPQAGFADPYLVNTGFAAAARRRGVKILEGVAVDGLMVDGVRVKGVKTKSGTFFAPTVISTQNIWAMEFGQWLSREIPLVAERHQVFAFQASEPYTNSMPVFKDLSSRGMLYYRPYGSSQMLVSEGLEGQALSAPDDRQGDISLDQIVEIGEQVAERFPAFGEGELAASWTGVYDVTPDWNPVLGAMPGLDGLFVGFGFSGHGFKLSPAIGKVLAQLALGLPTDVSLQPYRFDRFEKGELLLGKYGAGAVS